MFLLSHTRLADPARASDEIDRLAKFLGVENYDHSTQSELIESMQEAAAKSLGDVSTMTTEQANLVDKIFAAPRVDPRVVDLFSDGIYAIDILF